MIEQIKELLADQKHVFVSIDEGETAMVVPPKDLEDIRVENDTVLATVTDKVIELQLAKTMTDTGLKDVVAGQYFT